ncbi:MAG: family 78 glycoside hydrolase catalytic domain [Verrucomicrobiota bacterium]
MMKSPPTAAFRLLGPVLVMATLGPVAAAPTHLVEQPPAAITKIAADVMLVDFGRVAFGNLKFTPPTNATGEIKVHFGEAFTNGRIERKPPGSVRYAMTNAVLAGRPLVVAPAPDARNTEGATDKHPPAILTPAEWGVVLPFRWVEIEGWPGELRAEHLTRQAAFATTWDDDAASFKSSDDLLNRIWELSRYSIKATTFAGVYVDGDRERIPYEADAYLNQLSHYYTDRDTQMARDTFDHLMNLGTWPTDWATGMIFMAYADWRHTGDTNWLAPRYAALKSKLLLDRVGSDGLVRSEAQHIKRDDLVDWPKGERDGYVFTELNTVVNAFHLRALKLMAELGQALGHESDRAEFAAREAKSLVVFQEKFFDGRRGLYRDGTGTDHASLHANLFPLAFGIVPEANRPKVADWLIQRGMRCSVYAAQYLLEGLFENGQSTAALALMTAPGDRSWRHMVESGTTITWEAWDQKYKPNQDWNHAWGAAPANLLPRYVLGVEARTAGWSRALVRPNPGTLKFAEGKIPTPRGPIRIEWKHGKTFRLSLTLPPGVSAAVELPELAGARGVFQAGQAISAKRSSGRFVLAEDVSGSVTLEVK